MPIKITPKQSIPKKKLTISIKETLFEDLKSYCRYLGGQTDPAYVIEQLLEAQLSTDRNFQAWKNSNARGI